MKQPWLVCVLVLSAFVPAGRCEGPGGDTDDGKAIQGTWLSDSAVMAGKEFPEAVVKSLRLVLADGKYTVNKVDEGTVKLDPTKKPKAMDIVCSKGPNKGKTILAIYEMKGDTLRVCYDLSGKGRPEEFKSKPDTQLFLVNYRRQKP